MCKSNCLLSLLSIVSLIKKNANYNVRSSHTVTQVKCPWLSAVNKTRSSTRKENQSTSVNLSQAGDQIEKWIARCELTANLHCDQGAVCLSTCLEHDNGHGCRLAKHVANKDQITILAGEKADDKQVCWGPLTRSWSCLIRIKETTWQPRSLINTVCLQGLLHDTIVRNIYSQEL